MGQTANNNTRYAFVEKLNDGHINIINAIINSMVYMINT